MARSIEGGSLPGYLQMVNRKWPRYLTRHRGGRFAMGEMQLHLTGTAPGGFQMQIMQVDTVHFVQWSYRNVVWGAEQAKWATMPGQVEEAKRILKTSGLWDQFES